MKVLVLLQNAWSPVYAGGQWPRASWLCALHHSRSGQRLRLMIESCGFEVWYDNTTPIVGLSPQSVVSPDAEHINHVLTQQSPDYIVACGKQAAAAVKGNSWDHCLLIVPHPAYRVLTNALYARAGAILKAGFTGPIELVQRRNAVECIGVP